MVNIGVTEKVKLAMRVTQDVTTGVKLTEEAIQVEKICMKILVHTWVAVVI
jgi:hypothetical protein